MDVLKFLIFIIALASLEGILYYLVRRTDTARVITIGTIILLLAIGSHLIYWGLLVLLTVYTFSLGCSFSSLYLLKKMLTLAERPHTSPIFSQLLERIQRYGDSVPVMQWTGISWRWLMEQKLRGLVNEVKTLISNTVVEKEDHSSTIEPLHLCDLQCAISGGDLLWLQERLQRCRQEMVSVERLSKELATLAEDGISGDPYHRALHDLLAHLRLLAPYTHATELLAYMAGTMSMLISFETAEFSADLFETSVSIGGDVVRWKTTDVADSEAQKFINFRRYQNETIKTCLLAGRLEESHLAFP